MVYAGRYSAADPRPDTYKVYLESLADLAIWLLEHDYDIRLLLGDNDTVAIDDFRSILRTRMDGYDEERIIEQPITLRFRTSWPKSRRLTLSLRHVSTTSSWRCCSTSP